MPQDADIIHHIFRNCNIFHKDFKKIKGVLQIVTCNTPLSLRFGGEREADGFHTADNDITDIGHIFGREGMAEIV